MSQSPTIQDQQSPLKKDPTQKNSLPANMQMQDPIRLASIRAALKSLQSKNRKFMQQFELNTSWRKIYNALLTFNYQQQLSKLVELKPCEAKGIQRSYFDPFSTKAPISMCYNKINTYETFQKQLLFNLILHYDNKVKKDTNWNQLQPTAKSVIRGLNISGICQKGTFEFKQKEDRQCFQNQLKLRVLDKQRFAGIKFNFDQLLQKGLQDYEPISQIISGAV